MALTRPASKLPLLVYSAGILAVACLLTASHGAATSALPGSLLLLGCLGLLVAGTRVHLSIRLGAQRFELTWSEAALVVALAFVPAPWVIILTAPAVLLCFADRRLPLVKTVYNVAIYTSAAAVAAAIVTAAGLTRPISTREVLVLAVAGVAAGLVTYLAVAAVIAVVQDVSVLETWRASAGLQALTLVGNLCVAVAVLVLVQHDWRLVVIVPLIVLTLHQSYEARFRGRSERRAGQRKSVAVSHLTADLDELGVIRRATEEVSTLLTADAVEIELPAGEDAPARLYRHHRRAGTWAGDPDDAPPLPARLVARVPIAGEGQPPVGELRVWLAGGSADVRLSDWDEEALGILAATTAAALANARVHALQTHHATHDRLTGLPIRTVLLDRVHASAGAQAREGLSPVALILVDLSGYRDIVRSLGHDTAERLLARTAGQLRGAVIEGEFLAHIGADDFGVYLDKAGDPAHVHVRAKALLEAVAEPYRIDAGTVELHAVAGVAYSPTAVLSGAELLRQAVFALDHARDDDVPVKFYDPGADGLGGPAAMVMRSELHVALEQEQLYLEYQPVLALPSRAPIAVEALLRWLHPTRGMLYPREFMAVLEHSPDHGSFVTWQLRQALAARACWGGDRDVPVSINLAFRCLLDRAFPEQVAAALQAVGVPGDQLMLEFGESDSLTGGVPVTEALDELRDLGVRIAIDRFGDGACSLTGLLNLPATHLKIDPEFVRGAIDRDQVAVVSLAVELGRQSDLQVVAIGVPSDEHVEALVKLGCHAGQGRHLAAPMSARLIRDYLATAPTLPAPEADVIALDRRRRLTTPTK